MLCRGNFQLANRFPIRARQPVIVFEIRWFQVNRLPLRSTGKIHLRRVSIQQDDHAIGLADCTSRITVRQVELARPGGQS